MQPLNNLFSLLLRPLHYPSHVLYSQFQNTTHNTPKTCKATDCHTWGIMEDPVIDRPTDADELDCNYLKTGTFKLQPRASYLTKWLLVSWLSSSFRFCKCYIWFDLYLLRSHELVRHDGPIKEQSGYELIYFHRHETSVTINPLKTKRRLLYLKTQFVSCSKHFSSRL